MSPSPDAIAPVEWLALCVRHRDHSEGRRQFDEVDRERSLRRVALGRENYLFVGHVEAGASIAGLLSDSYISPPATITSPHF